ncbi:hypothetical protein Dimus_035664, partial [Dionaea muscipula]
MEIDVKVSFKQEKIPKIKKEPTQWSETYDIGALYFIEEWGKEIEEMFPLASYFEAIASPRVPKASTIVAPTIDGSN